MSISERRRSLASQLLAIMLATAFAVPAQAEPSPPTVTAQHAFVGDPLYGLDSAEGTLFSVAPDDPTLMASTTKIVSLHLAVDALHGRIPGACPSVSTPSQECHLGDWVTAGADAVVGSSWVPSGSSCMWDAANPPQTANVCPAGGLQQGELVQLADLLRGMMYPSGNDAAVALGDHVAGQVQTFVELMNDVTAPGHVDPQGLPNSHFTNPAGLDNWCAVPGLPFCDESFRKNGLLHYTTARDLSKIWLHASQDEIFRQVVGFQGTYQFCTTLPGGGSDVPSCTNIGKIGDRFFSYNWGGPGVYPGWEGAKGGGSTGCGSALVIVNNQPVSNNIGCEVMSTRRIGRQLVTAMMQACFGQPSCQTSDRQLMLDYAFARVFHPDLRDHAVNAESWTDQDVQCLPDGRAVSVGTTATQSLRLVTWGVDVDGSHVTKLAQGSLTQPRAAPDVFGLSPGVVSTRLDPTHIVTALTKSAPPVLGSAPEGPIKLTLWNIAADGTPQAVVKNVAAGQGRGVRLIAISDRLFVTSYVDGNEGVFKLWAKKVFVPPSKAPGEQGKPVTSLEEVRTTFWGLSSVEEADIAPVGGSYYFVSAHRRTTDGAIVDQVWVIDPSTGEIAPVGLSDPGIEGNTLSIAAIPAEATAPDEIFAPLYYATAFRTPGGTLRILYHRAMFGLDGFQGITLAGDTLDTGEAISGRAALAPFSTSGLVTAVVDGSAKHKLIVWETRRNIDDSISPYRIADRATDADATLTHVCGLPHDSNSDGDFLSASLIPEGFVPGALEVFAWRVGHRP